MSTSARQRGKKSTSAPSRGAARHADDAADGGAGARLSRRRPADYQTPSPEGEWSGPIPPSERNGHPDPFLDRDVARVAPFRLGETSRIRDRGDLALRALASSLGGSRLSPPAERIRETLAAAADVVRAGRYIAAPIGPGARPEDVTFLQALAEAATHPTAHVHAQRFLSVLHGANVGAHPPMTRGDALGLLRLGVRVLDRDKPKRRGGWSVSLAPGRPVIPLAEIFPGPHVTPMPIELMPKEPAREAAARPNPR